MEIVRGGTAGGGRAGSLRAGERDWKDCLVGQEWDGQNVATYGRVGSGREKMSMVD